MACIQDLDASLKSYGEIALKALDGCLMVAHKQPFHIRVAQNDPSPLC